MKIISEFQYRVKLRKIVQMSGAKRRCKALGKLNRRYFATRVKGE